MSDFGLGYRIDDENHAALAATASAFDLPAVPDTFAAPTSVSHRGWRKAKNQGQVGSCSGFSRASGEEVLNYIGTGGQVEHFSEMYAYLCNQKACGLLGSDQGATIDGSLKASQQYGICRAATFPYPGQYLTKIPAEAAPEGKKHLIRSHVLLPTADKASQWILSGNGVILIGITWTMGLRASGTRLTRSSVGGKVLGGHALVIHGVLPNGDLDLENSHSEAWGDKGFAAVEPELYDQWGRTGAALIGISDLQSYGFRKIATWGEMFG